MKIRLKLYKYNPETLDFGNIIISWKLLLKIIMIQSIISIGLMFFLSLFYNTPKENDLLNELREIKTEFAVINKKTGDIQYLLDILEQKDSVIYQSLFGIESDDNKFESGYLSNYSGTFTDTINNVGNKLTGLEMRLERYNLRFRKLIMKIGENDDRLRHMPAIQPISNNDLQRTSSGFGYRIHPIYNIKKLHKGMDFVAPIGTPIHATADGVVIIASKSYYGYGRFVKIRHNDEYKTSYAHLNELNVKKGEYVKRGDIIGTLGNTGLSTGPHLHYEVYRNNVQIDPINFYFHDLTADQYEEMIKISSNIKKSLD